MWEERSSRGETQVSTHAEDKSRSNNPRQLRLHSSVKFSLLRRWLKDFLLGLKHLKTLSCLHTVNEESINTDALLDFK